MTNQRTAPIPHVLDFLGLVADLTEMSLGDITEARSARVIFELPTGRPLLAMTTTTPGVLVLTALYECDGEVGVDL